MFKKKLFFPLICGMLLCGIVVLSILIYCRVRSQEGAQVIPHIGAVQVLNGCGEDGAGLAVRAFLQRRGFDVKECGNAMEWNYPVTVVAGRSEEMTVAYQVAQALGTDNVVQAVNHRLFFDVTVVVGRDYQRLVGRQKK